MPDLDFNRGFVAAATIGLVGVYIASRRIDIVRPDKPVYIAPPYKPVVYANYQPGDNIFIQGYGWYDDERVRLVLLREPIIGSDGQVHTGDPRLIAEFRVGPTEEFRITFKYDRLHVERPPILPPSPFVLAIGQKYRSLIEAPLDGGASLWF